MTLNQNDAELFYELWFPLLDYTNKKYKVNANLRKMHGNFPSKQIINIPFHPV